MAAIALLLVWVAFACGCLTAPQPGSLAVASEPAGAEVYLGGQYTGTAPLEITNLTPGEYVLRFSELPTPGSELDDDVWISKW
jgi:hypothetical protein